MKKIILILLFGFACLPSLAQGEANNWYFGRRAGIRFMADGSVTVLTDGLINTSEGCSSISDNNGNLLLYTDGRNVWDRNHVLMPNGDYNAGTGLLGDPSSTQSGIIIPKKGDPNIYYVFTVDEPHQSNAAVYPNQFNGIYAELSGAGGTVPEADDGYNNGLNYSVVDLSVIGANGSIGDVVTRNVHLQTYDPAIIADASFKCSEKITALKNNDGTGFWVISHFIDKFYAFRVDGNGVNPTPVVTQIAPVVPSEGYRRNSIGCIKASPDGKKLAIAHMQRSTVAGGTSSDGTVYLYDLDDATGILSNPIQIADNISPYGVEFSPAVKKLYISYDSASGSVVRQYDLLSTDVPASGITVANTQPASTLQLGPNGKIYRARVSSNTLDVIHKPDEDGTSCDFEAGGQSLGAGTSIFGLPPFITSLLSANIQVTNSCLGQVTQFQLSVVGNFDSITWDLGDGSATQSGLNPAHTYLNPGTYTVQAVVTNNGDVVQTTSEITIIAPPVANPASDLFECDDDNDGSAVFNLTSNTPDIIGLQNAATHVVKYYASQSDADIGVSITNPSAYASTSNDQVIIAHIFNISNESCYDATSFVINSLGSPNINLAGEAIACVNKTIPVTLGAGIVGSAAGLTYEWSTGETSPTISITAPGIYIVKVTNANGCEKLRTITVTPSDVAVINDIVVRDVASNNTVTVFASPTGNVTTTYLYSLDLPDGPYQESNIFENVPAGIHSVYVYDDNGCGVVSEEIAVLGIPKFFTPNADGVNDTWRVTGINAEFYNASSINIYDRYGKFLAGITPESTGWDGTYNGKPLPSTDYWYVVSLDNGRIIKGHFSLIR